MHVCMYDVCVRERKRSIWIQREKCREKKRETAGEEKRIQQSESDER